ncbi:MAG: NADH pyrophosphatase [Anaerolineales bacterium]|nr:NADH pyrophosphatase [Anaerolineales bacterium]
MALTQVHYCPRCGTAVTLENTFGKVRPVCPACNWIYFADPKVAAAVLIEENSRVLLVRRVNEPYRGLWTLPAGFVDAEEDPARAAERECREETGLIVRVTRVLQVVAGREHPRGADFVIVYAAQVESGNLIAGDDADEVGWFARSELPPLAFKATQSILSA